MNIRDNQFIKYIYKSITYRIILKDESQLISRVLSCTAIYLELLSPIISVAATM